MKSPLRFRCLVPVLSLLLPGAVFAQGAPAIAFKIDNGGMTQGEGRPDGWTSTFGEVETARDTQVFKEGPASLRVTAKGGKGGSGFQQIQGGAGAKVRVSGWLRTQGDVKAQAILHAFAEGFKNNQFIQLKFVQGESDWAEFDKEVQLPEWTAFFNVGLMAEGDGSAWLDEVRAGGAAVDPGQPLSADERRKTQPPAKAKPDEPGWGFYPQFPTAWQAHFQRQLDAPNRQAARVVFIGDSITQGWGSEGKAAWEKHFAPLGALNFGIGGDSTRQVLWRIDHGLLDALDARLVVLKIGTNNLYDDHNAGSDEEIGRGVEACVERIRKKLPHARVLLLGILPRQNDWFSGRIVRINERLAKFAGGEKVRFLNLGERFAKTRGKGDVIDELFTEDRLHLAPKGYDVFGDALAPAVTEMLGAKGTSTPGDAAAQAAKSR